MDSQEEEDVHHPPPSLVPRLHAVVAYKLQHNNIHIPTDVTGEGKQCE